MEVTSFNPTRSADMSFYASSLQSGENWISNVYLNSGTTIIYHIYAYIPLPIIHPVFHSLPMVRGMKLKITLNMNTGCKANITHDGTNYLTCAVSTPHGTLPFQVSPIKGGFYPGLSTSHQVNLELQNRILSCRCYMANYKLSPSYESKYIRSPVKAVSYIDYNSFSINNVGGSAQINNLLTNGIAKLRYFLMVPQLNQVSNQGFSPSSSPFSSAPGTCMPYSKISNFQLQIGGKNVFDNPQTFSFENYSTQVRPALAINGGSLNSMGLSSGAISKKMWENGYGYIYVDLSRNASEALDNASRSIQVVFKNDSNQVVDFTVIVGYERNFNINVSTGQYA
jgi:hypothetical protein